MNLAMLIGMIDQTQAKSQMPGNRHDRQAKQQTQSCDEN
jgi:hypothetical protein